MKITKYSHACFIAHKDGQSLVIDPGEWSKDLVIKDTIVGVVITHEHEDHQSHELLSKIFEQYPNATLYAHADVLAKLEGFPSHAVSVGDTLRVGNFGVEFFGGEHAVIHSSMPSIANLGVMLDDKVYYPGDSFSQPQKEVEVLALPAAAPWMKMSEAMDFYAAVKPTHAFPTHDAILSEGGKQLSDMLLGSVANDIGSTYERLESGQSLEI